MATCQSDYAAYLAAVAAGGNTAPTYASLYSDCHMTAAALTPVKAASMATPSDASSAQAAAALVASAVAGLPDLSVRLAAQMGALQSSVRTLVSAGQPVVLARELQLWAMQAGRSQQVICSGPGCAVTDSCFRSCMCSAVGAWLFGATLQ